MNPAARTARDLARDAAGDVVAREIAIEQEHVDRVYAQWAKALARTAELTADGLARGRTDRTGDVRDEELTGLFERDAIVHTAARRRASLDRQFEGLVFGRLDLAAADQSSSSGRTVRYVGRLGVRDDDYEPLVIDWRAPAAAPFYRATPVDPQGVIRRRVLRSRAERVIAVEDDLMVAQAPDDIVVVGDGALLAALTRSRDGQMRDIVATIQQHQDEAIRAPATGVTQITGGPGTGKTVVALHRAAYLLYADRRRFERGGVLVVGPSAAYTAYIERVLPSLGEDSVVLRSIGDLVDGMTATRLDSPRAAALKGSLRMGRLLARASHDVPPEAPRQFRAFVAGIAIRLDEPALRRVRSQVRRRHPHNAGVEAARVALAEAAWQSHRSGERDEFVDVFLQSREVDRFLAAWWPQLDPRQVLLWCARSERLARYAEGLLTQAEQQVLVDSWREALETGQWSVADVALVDDLWGRVGPRVETQPEERGFYEIEEYDDLSSYGVQEVVVGAGGRGGTGSRPVITPRDARDRLLHGWIERPSSYAHILVDEAQDLSPMQWRMLGRRGRGASWTVVGDAAQASWTETDEALQAQGDAFGPLPRRTFHMDTNYRNAREIFDHAARVILPVLPQADIPTAVRATGHQVREVAPAGSQLRAEVLDEVARLLEQVDGAVAVIAPHGVRADLTDMLTGEPASELADAVGDRAARVSIVDPLSSKGLEWDGVLVVDPDRIAAESPGGVRVLYVVLTRAAHRMTVLRPTDA